MQGKKRWKEKETASIVIVDVCLAVTEMESVRDSYGSRVISSMGSISRFSGDEVMSFRSDRAKGELSGLEASNST